MRTTTTSALKSAAYNAETSCQCLVYLLKYSNHDLQLCHSMNSTACPGEYHEESNRRSENKLPAKYVAQFREDDDDRY